MKRQVRSQAILRIWLGGAVMLSPLQVATAADRLFAGEDAAYIDWAFSNCKIVSTDKERGLASQASSKGGEAFVKAYERQFHKLAEAAGSAAARAAACEQVNAWYGPLGSRIPELLDAKVEQADPTPPDAASRAAPARSSPGPAPRGS